MLTSLVLHSAGRDRIKTSVGVLVAASEPIERAACCTQRGHHTVPG
jgi:hypothetical protein